MKSWRQSQVLDVIDREAISSQEGLRQKLKERGIPRNYRLQDLHDDMDALKKVFPE